MQPKIEPAALNGARDEALEHPRPLALHRDPSKRNPCIRMSAKRRLGARPSPPEGDRAHREVQP
jgi:hypothetical protein